MHRYDQYLDYVPNKIKVAGDDIYRYLTAQVDHNQGIDHIYAFQA
jgi:hypothetical protein